MARAKTPLTELTDDQVMQLMKNSDIPDDEPTNPSVSLSVEDWKNVLAAMEAGVKAIGYPAFETGGRIIREVSEQLNKHG